MYSCILPCLEGPMPTTRVRSTQCPTWSRRHPYGCRPDHQPRFPVISDCYHHGPLMSSRSPLITGRIHTRNKHIAILQLIDQKSPPNLKYP